MMEIKIKTGNDAFRGCNGEENIYYESMEEARLLRKLADVIEHSTKKEGSLNDINGNRVLEWKRN